MICAAPREAPAARVAATAGAPSPARRGAGVAPSAQRRPPPSSSAHRAAMQRAALHPASCCRRMRLARRPAAQALHAPSGAASGRSGCTRGRPAVSLSTSAEGAALLFSSLVPAELRRTHGRTVVLDGRLRIALSATRCVMSAAAWACAAARASALACLPSTPRWSSGGRATQLNALRCDDDAGSLRRRHRELDTLECAAAARQPLHAIRQRGGGERMDGLVHSRVGDGLRKMQGLGPELLPFRGQHHRVARRAREREPAPLHPYARAAA